MGADNPMIEKLTILMLGGVCNLGNLALFFLKAKKFFHERCSNSNFETTFQI
jgi:hypothetical protein